MEISILCRVLVDWVVSVWVGRFILRQKARFLICNGWVVC